MPSCRAAPGSPSMSFAQVLQKDELVKASDNQKIYLKIISKRSLDFIWFKALCDDQLISAAQSGWQI